MDRGRLVAELEHLAGDNDLSRRSGAAFYQRPDHRKQRGRIRIVRIVDDRKSFCEMQHLATLRRRRDRVQAGGDLSQRSFQNYSRPRGRQSIENIMFTV